MLWIIFFVLECALLSFIDRKLWKTYFSPLNFVMIPYMLVLIFTLCLAGRWGLEKFYFPSILPWIWGLPLFALGGYGIRFLFKGRVTEEKRELKEAGETRKSFSFWLNIILIGVLFGNFIYCLVISNPSCGLGTDCFADLLGRNRFFSHLLVILTALIPINVFLLEKKDGTRWILLLLSLFLVVFLQVKSWIILPVVAGIFSRILDKKNRMGLKTVAVISAVGTVFFFVSYLLIYVYGDRVFIKGTPFGEQFLSIGKLFLHYITSGTMGLSLDFQQGILEEPDMRYIFTPFYNLLNLFFGKELISFQNGFYLYSGYDYTNVRSLFGTLFVFSSPVVFSLIAFFLGAVCYMAKIWADGGRRSAQLVYCWLCTLLFMGWFDSYIQLSSSWEIPFWMVVISETERRLGWIS